MRSFRIALLLVGALFYGYFGRSTWAHGGGVAQLTNAEVGPYRVSVWTQPDPLRVGEAHFTVAVSEPPASDAAQGETGSPVLGATVELRLESENNAGQALVGRATHEAAVNKLFYEADLKLPAEGQWQVTVMVAGPSGSGSADFEIEVFSSGFNRLWLLGGLGLILLVAGWNIQRWFWKQKIGG